MAVTNEVEKVIAEMLDPKTTCKRCEFVVCPMLGSFAAKLKPASDRLEELEKKLDGAYSRISLLSVALTKVVDMTKPHANESTQLGCVNRVAQNALYLKDIQ